MLQKVTVVTLTLIALLLSAAPVWAAGGKNMICVAQDGALNLRKKCKAGESVFSQSLLTQKISESVGGTAVGPTGATGDKGPAGDTGGAGGKGTINFSACRIVSDYTTNFPAVSTGALTVTVSCDPNTEFLFGEDYKATALPASAGTTAYVQARIGDQSTVNGDTRDFSASIYFVRDASGGSGGFAGAYQAEARGICCPR